MKKIIFILIALLVLSVSAQDTTIVTYYENGNKSVEYSQKDGKRNGSDRFYNQDGTIRYEYNYKAGVLDGVALFYYDSGALYTKTIYADGTFVENIVYNEDGSVSAISKLEKGKCVEVDSTNKVIYSQIESIDKYCK
jgi:hypothetical protein